MAGFPSDVTAADVFGQILSALGRAIGDGDTAAFALQDPRDRAGHAAGSQEQNAFARQFGGLAIGGRSQAGQQGLPEGIVIGVIGSESSLRHDQRIGRSHHRGRGVLLFGHRQRCFLMRNRDAVTPNGNDFKSLQERGQLPARDAEGNVDAIDAQLVHGGIVNNRAEAVANGVADDSVNLSAGVDVLEEVMVLHLAEIGDAERKRSFDVEGGVGERRAELGGQDAARETQLAQT